MRAAFCHLVVSHCAQLAMDPVVAIDRDALFLNMECEKENVRSRTIRDTTRSDNPEGLSVEKREESCCLVCCVSSESLISEQETETSSF